MGVTHHRVLWSPDFPPGASRKRLAPRGRAARFEPFYNTIRHKGGITGKEFWREAMNQVKR